MTDAPNKDTVSFDPNHGEERVHEVELAKHGDHSSHENELVLFVVASSQKEAAAEACDLQIERRPDWHTDETTYLHRSSEALNSETSRQFIDETRDNVIVGPEVPV